MASSWAHRTPPGLFGANQVPVGIFPGPIFSSSGRFPSLRDQNAPTLHRCKAKPQVGDRGHATWGRFGQSPPEATEFTNPAVPTGHLCHHWAMNKAGGAVDFGTGETHAQRAKLYRRVLRSVEDCVEHRPEDKNLLQLLPGIFISTRGYPTDRDIQNELDITAAAVKHPQSVVIGQSAAFLHGLARTTEQLAQKDPIPVELGFRTHAIPSTRKLRLDPHSQSSHHSGRARPQCAPAHAFWRSACG